MTRENSHSLSTGTWAGIIVVLVIFLVGLAAVLGGHTQSIGGSAATTTIPGASYSSGSNCPTNGYTTLTVQGGYIQANGTLAYAQIPGNVFQANGGTLSLITPLMTLSSGAVNTLTNVVTCSPPTQNLYYIIGGDGTQTSGYYTQIFGPATASGANTTWKDLNASKMASLASVQIENATQSFIVAGTGEVTAGGLATASGSYGPFTLILKNGQGNFGGTNVLITAVADNALDTPCGQMVLQVGSSTGPTAVLNSYTYPLPSTANTMNTGCTATWSVPAQTKFNGQYSYAFSGTYSSAVATNSAVGFYINDKPLYQIAGAFPQPSAVNTGGTDIGLPGVAYSTANTVAGVPGPNAINLNPDPVDFCVGAGC